jgi:hypothetical protein
MPIPKALANMSGSQVVPRCTVGLAAGGSGGRTDTGGRTQLDMSESIAENSEAHRASAERGERSERGAERTPQGRRASELWSLRNTLNIK